MKVNVFHLALHLRVKIYLALRVIITLLGHYRCLSKRLPAKLRRKFMRVIALSRRTQNAFTMLHDRVTSANRIYLHRE